MDCMNQPPRLRYDAISMAMHWATAVVVTIACILGPGGFGRLMRNGIDPASRSDIVWHESLGMLILALTLLRLLWLALRPAAPQFSMSTWMHLASKGVQAALWGLMLALPVTALLYLGGGGHPLTLLGGLRVDKMPLIANLAIAKLVNWGDVHQFLGDAIMWLAGLHAAAAIYHHFVLKDGVLRSMSPR